MAWGDDAQAEAEALELRIDKGVGEQRRAISRSAVRMLDIEFESWNLGKKSGSDWESPRRAWALEQLVARRSVDHHAYSPEPSDAAGSDVELVPLADDGGNNHYADGIATPPDDSLQPHPRSPLQQQQQQQQQQQRPLPLSSEETAPQEEDEDVAGSAAGAAASRFSNASSAAPVPALDGPPSMHPAHGSGGGGVGGSGGGAGGGVEYPGIMSFVSPQSYALSADTALSDTLPMMALSRSQLSGDNALARLEDMGVTDIDLRIAKLERLLADPAAAAAPTPLRATPPPQRRRGARPAGDWVLSSASASPSPQRGAGGGGGGFGGGDGGYGDTDASSTPSPRSEPPAHLGRPETPHEFSDVPDGTSSRALSERGSGAASATRDGATALTSAHGDVETPSEEDDSDGGSGRGGGGGGGFSSDPEDSRSGAGTGPGVGVAASAASAGSFLRSPSLHASGAGTAPSSASASGESSGAGGAGEGFCCLIVVTEETVIVVGRGGSSSGDGSADDSKNEAEAEKKKGTVLRAKVAAGAATTREDVAAQVGSGVYAEEGVSLEALARRLRASDPRRRRGEDRDGGDRLSLVLQVSVEEGSTAAEAARGLGSFVEAVTHSNAACSVVLEAADAALAEALLRSAPRAARAELSAAEFALADALMPASGGGGAAPAVRVSALSWVGSETPPLPPQLLSLAHVAPCDSARVPPSPPRSEASSQLGGSSSLGEASDEASEESEVESYQESPPALSMSAGAAADGVEVGNLVLASHTTEGPWVEGCVISKHLGVSWVQQVGSPQLPAMVFRHLRKVGKAE